MALTEENGMTYNMPVTPAYNGFGGGFMNGDWSWLILLFLVFGGWGNGFGGGFGGGDLYPWMNNSQNINGGFRDQMLNTQISGIQNAITAGFGDVQTGLCGINGAIANASAQAEIAANARQMADMNQMFSLQSALQQCCCDNRAATADLKYTIATENCADRAAVSDALRDVLTAANANTQRILDQLCADKIEAKNDTIAQLRSELLYARGQASQDVQTAAIQAGQRALANEVEQYVLPTPRPAYIVQNPNCCQTTTCGCVG